MIGVEDSAYTYEYDDYYKILPVINNWSKDSLRINNGRKVNEGFVYSSDTNVHWMSVKTLSDWIFKNMNKNRKYLILIPYGRQEVTQEDVDAVVDVLLSDFLTQGSKVPLFEKVVSEYCKVNYAVSTNSATSALHLACLALDLSPGDWLWTTPITFVASANCGLYCGAQVDFVDINPKTYNMSIESLKHKLIDAEIHGKLPKVIIPVHFAGQSCDMRAINALSKQYGFKIIEDASHAIGGKYQNTSVGSCKYSDITVFSFHPVKIITTGEGGMAVTNDEELASKMRRLCSHGITRIQIR